MTTAARYHEAGTSHYYWPDGRPCYTVPKKSGGDRKTHVGDARKLGLLVSPTTVLKCLHKPQLESWKIEQACLAVLTSPRRDGEALDAFVQRVIQEDREHEEERNAAADFGTAIHDALENALNNRPFLHAEFVEPALKSLSMLGSVHWTERVVVGDGYAGRNDALFIDFPWRTYVDFKTCRSLPKAAYPEHRMQVASYAHTDQTDPCGFVRCALCYVSRTKPGDVLLDIIDDWEHDWRKFELLLRFWKLSNNI